MKKLSILLAGVCLTAALYSAGTTYGQNKTNTAKQSEDKVTTNKYQGVTIKDKAKGKVTKQQGVYYIDDLIIDTLKHKVFKDNKELELSTIIFADEPTGNLDAKSSKEVVDLLKIAQRKYHETVILVTHDQEIASIADRVITIEDGKIIQDTNHI